MADTVQPHDDKSWSVGKMPGIFFANGHDPLIVLPKHVEFDQQPKGFKLVRHHTGAGGMPLPPEAAVWKVTEITVEFMECVYIAVLQHTFCVWKTEHGVVITYTPRPPEVG